MSAQIEIIATALGRWLGGAMIGSSATDAAMLLAEKILRVPPRPRAPIDQRLETIETARTSLVSALEAMDELKAEAEQNAAQVELLQFELEKVEKQHASAHGELQNIRELTKLDTATVKRVMGVPTPAVVWTERVVSFFIGVGASVAASWIWSSFFSG